MGDKRIFEKLERVNAEKNKVVFKLEYKGKLIQKSDIEVMDYAQEIIDDGDLSLFYFFKDMANKLEDKIQEVHKKKIWDELNNGKNNGTKNGTNNTTDRTKK